MPSSGVMHDLVVVLPGILGSTLAKDGRLVWAPSAGAVLRAIRTFGGSLRELTLPPGIGDAHPNDGVEPLALMPDLHVLPGIWTAHIGYGKLLDWLQTRFHLTQPSPQDPSRVPNLLPIPYDWRLSNRYNGRRLKTIIQPALERLHAQGGPWTDAKIIFICHSMGGLVARWYIEKEGGAQHTRKLLTLGTPYRGALNALDQLVNGVHEGIYSLKIDLTTFARSLPSLYQLLPEYACIESPGGLLKTTEAAIPHANGAMLQDAMRFHDEIDQAALANTTDYDIQPVVGFRQPTSTTARVVNDTVETVDIIGGADLGGDGTVPRIAAVPKTIAGQQLPPDSPIIRWVAEQHGSLQSNHAVLDELEGALTAQPVVYRAVAEYQIGVRTRPIVMAGQPVVVEATVAEGERVALQARVYDEQGKELSTATLRPSGGVLSASIDPPLPGAYRVVVDGVRTGVVAPVTSTVLVWG